MAWLGISKPTLLSWLRKKNDPFPGVKIGGKWIFRRQAVVEWWQRQEPARLGENAPSSKDMRATKESAPEQKSEELQSWLLAASKVLSEESGEKKKKDKKAL